MVVRKRLRAILMPVAFYLVLGGASSYLVWGASKGDRGLVAKLSYDAQAAELRQELEGLQQDRKRWERRVAALRSESVDRDLVEEEAHKRLDRAYKDEVVIFTDAK